MEYTIHSDSKFYGMSQANFVADVSGTVHAYNEYWLNQNWDVLNTNEYFAITAGFGLIDLLNGVSNIRQPRLSLEQVARHPDIPNGLSVTRERVRQRQASALRKLQQNKLIEGTSADYMSQLNSKYWDYNDGHDYNSLMETFPTVYIATNSG